MQSVENALKVLDLFMQHEELSSTEVANLTGLGKCSAFRLLSTLSNSGYLSKNSNAKYRLGVKLYSLGQLVFSRMEIISHVHPYLVELTASTGETSHLVIWDGNSTNVIFIDKVLSNSSIRMDSVIGLRRTAHMTATGKCLLAFRDEDWSRHYMKTVEFVKATPFSKGSAAELSDELEQVRREGYACDAEESELGLTCYAAPILDIGGKVLAAISVSGPTSRMQQKQAQLTECVRDTARRISVSLA